MRDKIASATALKHLIESLDKEPGLTAKPVGSLAVVGTGIKLGAHLTPEARGYIEQADWIYYVVVDEATERWMRMLNPRAESLSGYYAPEKRCVDTYGEMVEHILRAVRSGGRVCAVFYGHPGIFVLPARVAIQRARAEGYVARLLPGISAEDCLYADLGVDPGTNGCQSFEATDFLIRGRRFDPRVALILWQIGVIGDLVKRPRYQLRHSLQVLVEVLQPHYGLEHQVALYVAARDALHKPEIEWVVLRDLPDTDIQPIATLYVPPIGPAPIDRGMLARLGIALEQLERDW